MTHPAPTGIAAGQVKPWHVVLLYTMTYCVAVVASHYWVRGFDDAVSHPLRMVYIHAANCILFLLVTLCIPELRRSIRELFRESPTPLRTTDVVLTVGLIICWGVGLYSLLVLYPIAAFTRDGYDWLEMGPRGSVTYSLGFLLVLVVTAILAPLGEELVFRGFLLNMWRERYRLWVAIGLSTLVFGIFHFKFTVFATVTGVMLSLVYLRHGSLRASILVHAIYNLIVTITGLNSYALAKSRQTVDQLSSWSLEIVLAIAFFPLAYLFWRRYKPQ